MELYKLVSTLLRDAMLEPLAGTNKARRILRVLYEPSFEDWVSYQLVERIDRRRGTVFEYAVTRRVWRQAWDRRGDETEFLKRQPAFDYAFAPIAENFVNTLVQRLRSATVPPWTSTNVAGLDGWTTTLILGEYMASCEMCWWCEGPTEWAAIIGPTHEFLERVRKLRGWETLGEDSITDHVSARIVWDSRDPIPDKDYTLLRDAVPPLRDKTPAEVLAMIRSREIALGRVKWGSACVTTAA